MKWSMVMTSTESANRTNAGVPLPLSGGAHAIHVFALGMSLGLFLLISYLLCILGYLLFPSLPISHASLAIFLPGFELLSWRSFFLGAAESYAWGWYVALILGPLYNFFVARWR
jgi:hypothetical protein